MGLVPRCGIAYQELSVEVTHSHLDPARDRCTGARRVGTSAGEKRVRTFAHRVAHGGYRTCRACAAAMHQASTYAAQRSATTSPCSGAPEPAAAGAVHLRVGQREMWRNLGCFKEVLLALAYDRRHGAPARAPVAATPRGAISASHASSHQVRNRPGPSSQTGPPRPAWQGGLVRDAWGSRTGCGTGTGAGVPWRPHACVYLPYDNSFTFRVSLVEARKMR